MGPLVAIVLAAGAGRRVGGPKALLDLGGRSFLAHCAERLRRPGVSAIVAVAGHAREAVLAAASAAGIDAVVNERPDDGMLGSILRGLDEAERRGADAVLVHPVDHPLVAPETVDRVVAALAAGAWIAVPSWQGRRGHPAGFSREAWAALRAAPMDRGARAVLADHPEWIHHVSGDAGCRLGVNTAEDLGRVRAQSLNAISEADSR